MELVRLVENVESDAELKGILAKVKPVRLTDEEMIRIQQAFSGHPKYKFIEFNASLGSWYCDGTDETYQHWRKLIEGCRNSPKIAEEIKEYLALVD